MVSDVSYILNMAGSVTIEDADEMFVMTNADETTFGCVQPGQTIYLNKLVGEPFDLFAFEE